MNVRILEYVLAIERCGSLTAAAGEMNVSPSALTQHLKKLEAEIGAPVFIHPGKLWVPTSAGRHYLRAAKEMLEIKESTYQKIKNITDYQSRVTRISLCPEVMQGKGDKLLSALFAKYGTGDFLLELQELSSEEALKLLSEGRLDAAAVAQAGGNNLDYTSLYVEETVLTVPCNIAWDGDAVEWDTLQDRPFIYTHSPELHPRNHRMLTERHIVFSRMHHASSLHELCLMTSTGYGMSLLPLSIARTLSSCRWYHWEPEERYQVSLAQPRHRPVPGLDAVMSENLTS